MAIFRWRGGTSTAWNNGTNWIDTAGAAYAAGRYPGSIPATYDQAWFDAARGSGNAPAGYDGTADEILLEIRVGPEWDSTIGASGAPIITGTRPIANGGNVMINAKSTADVFLSSTVADTLYKVRVLSGDVSLAGNLNDVNILKGNVTIETGAVITDPFHVGQLSSAADAVVTIESGVTLTSPSISSGSVICASAVATELTMTGGMWQQSGNIALLTQDLGTLDWRSGTISDAYVYGGRLDGSKSVAPKTLTQATVFQSGIINLNNGVGNIVVTNWIEYQRGTVYWPRGEIIYPTL